MANRYFFLIILGVILFGSLSSALTVDIPIPINYSLIPTVNASEYWVTNIGALDNVNATQFDNNGGTLSIDDSWISSWADGLYCLLTGCTMSGDIDMDGNNILNGNSITSDYVQVGEELNVYGDSYLNNTYPQSSLSSSLGSGALRWLNLFVQNINAEEIETFNLHATENITTDGFFIGDFVGDWDGAEDYWLRDGSSVASGNWDLGVYDFIAQYINATADLDVMDDLFVYDDTSLYDDLEVWGLSEFFGETRFNDSISLTTTSGDAILEIETENSSESSELRLLADGTNDLYIYTYGSTAAATYYGLPRAGTSYVDARGERFVLGTFDGSPMYLATNQNPRFILTAVGDLIPFDDEDYDIGNTTNRLRDLYITGEDGTGGIRFVEDDGTTIGNLSMDDDLNLLWNGGIIGNSSFNVTYVSDNYYLKTNPFRFWNDTYATFNKTYADTIYSPISEPLSPHLNQDNWQNDSNGWINWDGDSLEFNESKIATTYYNATQSQAVAGTIDGGIISLTQHPDGDYDGITFNFSEASGSPGLDLRVNFTGVSNFNKGYIRYKTSSLSGDYPAIQLWDYDEAEWEGGYGFLSETADFLQYTNDVLDSDSHLQDGIVQMRLYKSANGNTQNEYYVDMLAIVDGYATPSGNVDLTPYWRYDDNDEDRNFLTDGNVSADWFFGNSANFTTLNVGNANIDHISEKTAGHNVTIDTGVDSSVSFVPIALSGVINIVELQFKDGLGGALGSIKDSLYIRGITANPSLLFTDILGTSTSKIDYNTTNDRLDFKDATGGYTFDNNVTVEGNITADYLFGDGSQLTGIEGDNSSWNESYADGLYAKYQFEANNFNGSGDLTTTGDLRGATITSDTIQGYSSRNTYVSYNDVTGDLTLGFAGAGDVISNSDVDLGNNDLTLGGTLEAGRNAAMTHTFESSSYPVVRITRYTSTTNAQGAAYDLTLRSTGNMADDFGGGITISAQDATAGPNIMAAIYGIRAGSDTTGDMWIRTRNAGNWVENLYLRHTGNVDIPTDNSYFRAGVSPTDLQMGSDGTNGIFNTSGIAWFSNNVSATGYITRTSTYDKTKGNALDKIKDSDDLKDENGKIKHKEFYGYVTYNVTDFNRPVNESYEEEVCSTDEKTKEEVCENETIIRIIYPYEKEEEGVDLVQEIELLRQSLVEQKLINLDLISRIEKLEKI